MTAARDDSLSAWTRGATWSRRRAGRYSIRCWYSVIDGGWIAEVYLHGALAHRSAHGDDREKCERVALANTRG